MLRAVQNCANRIQIKRPIRTDFDVGNGSIAGDETREVTGE